MARLTPPPLEIGKEDGFDKHDIFKARPFGERLAIIVEQAEEPLVIAIDGPWGSGKSVFAKQWAGLLRQRKIPVIEFDAFANDYQEDAFVALASEIVAYAREVLPESGVKSFIDGASKLGRALIPVATKVAIKAATLGLISSDDVGKTGEQIADATAADTGVYIEKLLQDRLKSAESSAAMMRNFGRTVEELAAKLAQGVAANEGSGIEEASPFKPRLVIIIDELDRCKPAFALDLLEKIKHFYSIGGLVFVMATNIKQLEAAVRGRYGAETDATTYLQKFIMLQFGWHATPSVDTVPSAHYVSTCISSISGDFDRDCVSLLINLCKMGRPSLRQVEKICSAMSVHSEIYSTTVPSNSRWAKLRYCLLIFMFLREVGVDIMRYSDKEVFVSESCKALSLNNPPAFNDGRDAIFLHAYLILLFSVGPIEFFSRNYYASYWGSDSQKDDYNLVSRRLRGENVL